MKNQFNKCLAHASRTCVVFFVFVLLDEVNFQRRHTSETFPFPLGDVTQNGAYRIGWEIVESHWKPVFSLKEVFSFGKISEGFNTGRVIDK